MLAIFIRIGSVLIFVAKPILFSFVQCFEMIGVLPLSKLSLVIIITICFVHFRMFVNRKTKYCRLLERKSSQTRIRNFTYSALVGEMLHDLSNHAPFDCFGEPRFVWFTRISFLLRRYRIPAVVSLLARLSNFWSKSCY